MASEVTICNRALQAIGTRTSIASLSEDSVEARNCALIYADTRDEILGMAFWNFARKTDYLALQKSAPGTPSGASFGNQWSTAYPAPPWLYQYGIPADCIRVQRVMQMATNAYVGVPFTSNGISQYPYAVGPGAPFVVATDTDSLGNQRNVILTNQYQAIGQYTMRVTNPALFSATFVEALVQAIAAKLVLPLNGQVSMMNTKFAQANAILTEARADDGNEGLTVIDNIPDWIAVREDYAGYSGYGIDFIGPLGSLYAGI